MPLKPNGFPREEKIRARGDFNAAYSGKRLAGKFFILHYIFVYGQPHRKAAFTVSRKVSRLAVNRNKLKRRLREIYRCNRNILPDNILMIVRSLPRAAGAGFNEIREELVRLFASVASKKRGH